MFEIEDKRFWIHDFKEHDNNISPKNALWLSIALFFYLHLVIKKVFIFNLSKNASFVQIRTRIIIKVIECTIGSNS